jgi:3-oxoacyl-[acyl-carrier-protein] synthase-3
MNAHSLYVSRPGVSFPAQRVGNAEIVRRVKDCYRGPEAEWPRLASAIEHVFGICHTRERYLDSDGGARVADYAVAAARHCLEVNQASLDEVDLVLCGGIARQYFEPATAMEVAAKLGLKDTHALDVTAACVGHLEALQAAAGYLALKPHYRTALVCTAELTGPYLSYDIQSVRDLNQRSAGLTIGNAATCVLLRRAAWPRGGIRLLGIDTRSVPRHWKLCQVPIDGTFRSSSVELMRLGRLVPPLLRDSIARVGWSPEQVDHFVFHQPSEAMVKKILEDIGANPERGVYSHRFYGNTASASVGVTYDLLLKQREPAEGDRLVLGSAAAGFSIVIATGEWHAPGGESGDPGASNGHEDA